MNSLAITDHGNLSGAIEFHRACRSRDVNPIIGYEAYVAPGRRTDRSATRQKDAQSHLTLLAMNRTGFDNLIQLASANAASRPAQGTRSAHGARSAQGTRSAQDTNQQGQDTNGPRARQNDYNDAAYRVHPLLLRCDRNRYVREKCQRQKCFGVQLMQLSITEMCRVARMERVIPNVAFIRTT